MKKVLLTLSVLFHFMYGESQKYDVYLGANVCNLMRTRHGQQTLYGYVENAPLWNIGFQFGINRTYKLSSPLDLKVGLRAQLRGDKYGIHVIAPEQDTIDVRMYYLLFPVNLKWKLLDNHGIYFQAGVSPDFLVYQNEVNSIPVFGFENDFFNRFGLTGQIGFAFDLGKLLSFETMYSQSLISFYNISLENFPDKAIIRHYHQAFEFTLIHKFK